MQLTLSFPTPATIFFYQGNKITGNAIFLNAGIDHSLQASSPVTLIFLEPQSAISQFLFKNVGEVDAKELQGPMLEMIDLDGPLNNCIEPLFRAASFAVAVSDIDPIDPRISGALSWLEQDNAPNAISRAANAIGLSDSRLRALARQHLGTPLSSWLLWRKLERAGRSLEAGASLTEAAIDGGFADQAHFNRTMRKMFGITPNTLRNLFS